jgi:acetyl-CoA carboxylase carboxyl transferase subunit alpha
MAVYLDFEEPLKALEEQIEQTKEIGASTEIDMSDKINELKQVLEEKTKEIFSGLTPWQRVQLSRHPAIYASLYKRNYKRRISGIAWRP